MASKFLKLYDSILKLVSNELNFKNLRTKIHSADPPLIPFPGIYQSDLVSILCILIGIIITIHL